MTVFTVRLYAGTDMSSVFFFRLMYEKNILSLVCRVLNVLSTVPGDVSYWLTVTVSEADTEPYTAGWRLTVTNSMNNSFRKNFMCRSVVFAVT